MPIVRRCFGVTTRKLDDLPGAEPFGLGRADVSHPDMAAIGYNP